MTIKISLIVGFGAVRIIVTADIATHTTVHTDRNFFEKP
jgi:hypothetical protein